MGVESVNIYADTSILYQQSNFLFNLAKYAENQPIDILIPIPIPKKGKKLNSVSLCVEKSSAAAVRTVELGLNVGRGANTARNLGNRPKPCQLQLTLLIKLLRWRKRLVALRLRFLKKKT